MNRLVFMLVICVLFFIGCNKTSDGQLGIFKGSIKDLLAQDVGEFKLNRSQPLPKDDKTLTDMGATDGALAKYSLGSKEVVVFLALNFDSSENAKSGFNKFKEKMNLMNLKTQEEGQKKKGNTVVGDRIMARGDGQLSAAESLAWTNGSVLFTVSSRGLIMTAPSNLRRNFSTRDKTLIAYNY